MFTRTEQMLSPLALVDVAHDFVGEKENRKQLFGKFSANVSTNGKLETKQEVLYKTVVI